MWLPPSSPPRSHEAALMPCRSPSRTPSRSPPKGSADAHSVSSQHVSDMQTSSSQHMSESSSSRNPAGRSPLSRATHSRDHQPQPQKSPFRAFANSSVEASTSPPDGADPSSPPEASSGSATMSAMPQTDASVRVTVQRSFLAAAKQSSDASPPLRRSPLTGKGGSPGNGLAMAYSASSEDGTSTSGWFTKLLPPQK